MNYSEAVHYLANLGRELAAPAQTRANKFDLANISTLAGVLGDPQTKFRSVHIAGTNGKGSTAAMLDSILRCAGFSIGLYTSPHLERINERVRINGREISEPDFAVAFSEVRTAIEFLLSGAQPYAAALASHPSFFECVTALAFVAFVRARVDFAVLEVGMGGRLDATNIVSPEVAVITQIDFDHEALLGHRIEQIAGEKAGIIKPGVPVVCAAQNPAAREVIRKRAAELAAPLLDVDELANIEIENSSGGTHTVRVPETDQLGPAAEFHVQLPGRFQVRNALAAFAAARLLTRRRGVKLDDRTILDGIAAAPWPGRLEKIGERPLVYLDGAHNPAGARELAGFCDAHFAGRRLILIYGAVRDKAVDEVAGLLFPRAAHVIVTAANQPRALSADALAEITHGLAREMEVVPRAADALARAMRLASPDDVILITGSLYLVGELRPLLLNTSMPASAPK